jgi:hypothetical protein
MQKRGLEERLAYKDKFDRLFANPDFQDVVQKLFCEQEALAYLGRYVDSNLSDDARAEGLEMAKAAASLKLWFQIQGQLLDRTPGDLQKVKDEIEWTRQEGN